MRIALAEKSEIHQIIHLLSECGLPFQDISLSKDQLFFVTKKGDKVVGVIGLEILGEVGLLRSLAVSPKYRGQGIAKRLVRIVENYTLSIGVKSLYLLTTTAEKFFSKIGYQKVNRNNVPQEVKSTQEFQFLCPKSSVCMMKNL